MPYTDQATLATTNSFVDLCRIALIKRALELNDNSEKQSVAEMNLYQSIIQNPDTYASKMAWLIAAGSNIIAAAAPAVPNDTDVQDAVNTMIPYLMR